MSRVTIFKNGQSQLIKQDRIERFLEQGWQLVAEPAPKKVSLPKVKVEASADVKREEIDWDPPLVSMPTDNQ